VRVNRVAYREYTKNPELSEGAFRDALGKEVFGNGATEQKVGDLLFLQGCWFDGAEWFTPALFLRPSELKIRAEREKWPEEKMQSQLARIERLRELAKRYGDSKLAAEREMARIASLIVRKWE